jgi:hypothetical protein
MWEGFCYTYSIVLPLERSMLHLTNGKPGEPQNHFRHGGGGETNKKQLLYKVESLTTSPKSVT